MLRRPILGICVNAMILFFWLHKYQVKRVEMTTLLVPGEPNVQMNVPLLLRMAFDKVA